jgi:hypothetical protein
MTGFLVVEHIICTWAFRTHTLHINKKNHYFFKKITTILAILLNRCIKFQVKIRDMFFIWPTECMYLQQSIGLMLLNVSKVDHHYFMHPHVGLLGLKLFAHESDKSWKLLIETKKMDPPVW